MPVDMTHLFPAGGLIIELLGLIYIVRVEHEVAADLKRAIEAYGTVISAQDPKSKS
jgi:hypothetical protein